MTDTMSLEENLNATREFLKNINVENPMNANDKKPPFGYFNPETEGKLIWLCNYDQDNKITQVYQLTDPNKSAPEKTVSYIDTVEEAIRIRDVLIANGWRKLVPPKITFTMDE